MRRIISVLAVVAVMAAMLAATALPAFAIGKNPPTTCGLGGPVSFEAHIYGGFGHRPAFNPPATNPGHHLQIYREAAKAGCTGQP